MTMMRMIMIMMMMMMMVMTMMMMVMMMMVVVVTWHCRGKLMSSITDHVANFFGLIGPTVGMEAACASSMVAVAQVSAQAVPGTW